MVKRIISFFAVSLSAGLLAVAQNTTAVKPGAEKAAYNPNMFSFFIEHFDNQVYGGIYDPGNPLSDEDGFRTDVIEAVRYLKVPLMRWPGGCFASTYHWKDAVGPERRPAFDKTWGVEEPNTFGTDEFVKWCRKVGCEPYIITNAGTGTLEEMSDWVEYCNLNVGYWGRRRIANGFAEPHKVKYWCIGNENLAPWEMQYKTPQEWGPLVREGAKMMLVTDKDIRIGASSLTTREAMLPLLQNAGHLLDFIAVHCGWEGTGKSFVEVMMETGMPEAQISTAISILDEAGYGGGRMKLVIDEWQLRGWVHHGMGDPKHGFDFESRRQNDIASTYTLSDAVYAACFLNTCLRHCDVIDFTCFSTVVNTRGAIFVHPKGIVKRVIYHALGMYSNLLLPYVVPTEQSVGKLVLGDRSTDVLDVLLTSDKEGTRFVYAVANKDPENAQPLLLDFKGLGKKVPKNVKATVLSGASPDDYNDIGHEDRVTPSEKVLPVRNGAVAIPAHSVTFISVE